MSKREFSQILINNASMGSDVISEILRCKLIRGTTIEVKWSGSPTGTFNIQRTNEEDPEESDWQNLDFGETVSAGGSSGNHQFDIRWISFSKLRVKYTRISGSGTLKATANSKDF